MSIIFPFFFQDKIQQMNQRLVSQPTLNPPDPNLTSVSAAGLLDIPVVGETRVTSMASKFELC